MFEILPVYKVLSTDNLLTRCLRGYNQNNNESVNSVIWKIAPKISSESAEVIQIAANCLQYIKRGSKGVSGYYAGVEFENWRQSISGACMLINSASMLPIIERRKTREARSARRLERLAAEDILTDVEELQYGTPYRSY